MTKARKRELHELGPPRSEEREQRSFLSHIAEEFQDRVRAALAADYTADPVFDEDELRLITHVVNITDVFNDDFLRGGHSRYFEKLDASVSEDLDRVGLCDHKDVLSPRLSATHAESVRELVERAKVDIVDDGESAELGDIIAPSS